MKTVNLTNHCPMIPIQYNKSSITHLSDSILIISRNKNNINLQCPNQNTTEIVNEPDIFLILIFPAKCTVQIRNTQLRLKLPKLVMNRKLIEKFIFKIFTMTYR